MTLPVAIVVACLTQLTPEGRKTAFRAADLGEWGASHPYVQEAIRAGHCRVNGSGVVAAPNLRALRNTAAEIIVQARNTDQRWYRLGLNGPL